MSLYASQSRHHRDMGRLLTKKEWSKTCHVTWVGKCLPTMKIGWWIFWSTGSLSRQINNGENEKGTWSERERDGCRVDVPSAGEEAIEKMLRRQRGRGQRESSNGLLVVALSLSLLSLLLLFNRLSALHFPYYILLMSPMAAPH